MVAMPSVLIVGGGIAGLSAARAISQRGIDCEIVEIQPEWKPHGTGVYTPANGVDALRKLGIGDDAVAAGVPIRRREIATAAGKPVMDLDLEEVWGRGRYSLGIARPALHRALRESTETVPVLMGTTVTRIEASNGGVEVQFDDDSVRSYDVVVGADGANSRVRSLILGDIEVRQVLRRTCRFLTTRPPGVDAWTLRAGRDGTILIIPVTEDTAYVYVQRRDRAASESKSDWMAPFADFAEPIPSALLGWSEDNAYWDALTELAPVSTWGQGRVVLIGDAAHSMPPFMAEGAALAVEDALELADVFASDRSDDEIAEALTARRADRVEWVRERNRRREKLTRIPFPIAVLGLRLMGARTWTEDYEPLRPDG